MPKISLRIGQAEVYVPLHQLEKAMRHLLAGQDITPQSYPVKHGMLANLAGDMLNGVELNLGSNFACLGSAMIVGRKQFLPEDRWAANALRGLHEALGFTRHFTDLGEQAWRTKVAEAIARMGSGDDEGPKEEILQEPKEENLREPRKEDCKEQQAQKEQHAQKEQLTQKAAGSCAIAHSQPPGRQVRPPKANEGKEEAKKERPRCADDAGAYGKGKAKSPLNQEETATARGDTASVEPFTALVDTAPLEYM